MTLLNLNEQTTEITRVSDDSRKTSSKSHRFLEENFTNLLHMFVKITQNTKQSLIGHTQLKWTTINHQNGNGLRITIDGQQGQATANQITR